MTSTSPVPSAYDFYEWHRWCKILPKVRRFSPLHDPKGRFTFYATARNAKRPGRPELELREGVHGVRNRRLLTIYKETLERAYDFFVKQGRPEPERGKDGRVPVYVFAVDDDDLDCGSPCMDELLFLKPSGLPDRVVPVLALPSRCAEPVWKTEEDQAQATAVHELSHLFNARFLPYRRLGAHGPELLPTEWISSWLWLDEGIAVAAEAEAVKAGVLSKNIDWLGFALDWVDRPGRALDDPAARYQSALFVRYVKRLMARQKDPTFLNRVWQMAQTVWNPKQSQRLAAVQALEQEFGRLARPLVFCSAHKKDVFSSGFCLDSYFLHDPNSLGYEPEVSRRFKERAVTRTWPLRRGQAVAPKSPEWYPLAGLACRYFRFIPGKETSRLKVIVKSKPGGSLRNVKAELALAAGRTKWYVPKTEVPSEWQSQSGHDLLICELPSFSSRTCNHAVLVVTNCAFAAEQPGQLPPFGYTQRIEFTVEAECS